MRVMSSDDLGKLISINARQVYIKDNEVEIVRKEQPFPNFTIIGHLNMVTIFGKPHI